MLHAKIIDTSKNESIEISKAENFLNQSKFGAVIYFVGTVRDLNENSSIKDLRNHMINFIDLNFKGNETFKKLSNHQLFVHQMIKLSQTIIK